MKNGYRKAYQKIKWLIILPMPILPHYVEYHGY